MYAEEPKKHHHDTEARDGNHQCIQCGRQAVIRHTGAWWCRCCSMRDKDNSETYRAIFRPSGYVYPDFSGLE